LPGGPQPASAPGPPPSCCWAHPKEPTATITNHKQLFIRLRSILQAAPIAQPGAALTAGQGAQAKNLRRARDGSSMEPWRRAWIWGSSSSSTTCGSSVS
jgi:hypothetical protein